jgi:hypothetical protein
VFIQKRDKEMSYRIIKGKNLGAHWREKIKLITLYTCSKEPVNVGRIKNCHYRWVFYIAGSNKHFICETDNDVCKCLLSEFGIKKKPSFLPHSDINSYLKACVAAKELGVMTIADMHKFAYRLGYRAAGKWKYWDPDESHREITIQDYAIDNHHFFLVIESIAIGPIKSMRERFDALLTVKGCIDIYFQIATFNSTCVSCPKRRGCKFLKEHGMSRAQFLCGEIPLLRIRRDRIMVNRMFFPCHNVAKELAAAAVAWDKEHRAEIKPDYSESNYQVEDVSVVACSEYNHHSRLQ